MYSHYPSVNDTNLFSNYILWSGGFLCIQFVNAIFGGSAASTPFIAFLPCVDNRSHAPNFMKLSGGEGTIQMQDITNI